MSKKIYCGIGKTPKGHRLGSMVECLENKKVNKINFICPLLPIFDQKKFVDTFKTLIYLGLAHQFQ